MRSIHLVAERTNDPPRHLHGSGVTGLWCLSSTFVGLLWLTEKAKNGSHSYNQFVCMALLYYVFCYGVTCRQDVGHARANIDRHNLMLGKFVRVADVSKAKLSSYVTVHYTSTIQVWILLSKHLAPHKVKVYQEYICHVTPEDGLSFGNHCLRQCHG